MTKQLVLRQKTSVFKNEKLGFLEFCVNIGFVSLVTYTDCYSEVCNCKSLPSDWSTLLSMC